MKIKIIFGLIIFVQLTFTQTSLIAKFNSVAEKEMKNIFSNEQLTATSVNPNLIYISPVPGSVMNSPETNIIIRAKDKIEETSVSGTNAINIIGSQSGIHSSKSILSDDGYTIVVQPKNIFVQGEKIEVILTDGWKFSDGSDVGQTEFSFSISKQQESSFLKADPIREEKKLAQNIPAMNLFLTDTNSKGLQKINNNLTTLPSDYPSYSVKSVNPSNGFIFLGNFTWVPNIVTQPYMLIVDNDGNPFFYKKLQENCLDFKMQPSGLITYYDGAQKIFYGLDTTFSVVDSFYCKNGYATDLHELRILPNGHFLLIGDDFQTVDMSKIVAGGQPNALVMGTIIQELDKNKNVVFQWRSWDHFNITDAVSDISMVADTIDYVHTNAIDIDNDENLIISNRHLDEVTKINRQTGAIIWRMGGKNNQFIFTNDPIGFSHQHGVRRISNGDIVVFDNGNLHYSQSASRALEYKVDEQNMKVDLVWQYRNTPDEYSEAMGDVQRLDNGNTLIGWGATSPSVTEISPTGEKVFELTLPDKVFSYRAYRFQLGKPFYSAFVPKLKYPPSGIHTEANSINLTWSRNKLAQYFRVQIATDTAFTNLVFDNSSIADTTIKVQALQPGKNYYWHVLSNNNGPNIGGHSGYSDTWNFNTSPTAVSSNNQLPNNFSLSQNYPNPFNPSTVIEFELPQNSFVRLDIYDILGQKVKELVDDYKPAGYYTVDFDAKDLPSGIYIYSLEAGSYEKTMKMIVMK